MDGGCTAAESTITGASTGAVEQPLIVIHTGIASKQAKLRILDSFVSRLFYESAMTALVMRLQQVQPEVAVVIAPHRVDVVGAILGVVVLDQENRRLDAIVVRPAALQS